MSFENLAQSHQEPLPKWVVNCTVAIPFVNLLKSILSPFLKLMANWYLSKERTYKYQGISLKIPPGVFHPGLFFSTKLLIKRIQKEKLKGKTILELGMGSGLISLLAAKNGAHVLATDINPKAIENLRKNAASNKLKIEIMESDLFDAIPIERHFDFILINPPFYPKEPKSMAGRAWYCGENFEYFIKLFTQLPQIQAEAIWIILSEDCDLKQISTLARKNLLKFEIDSVEKNLWERNTIFSIRKVFNPENSDFS